MGIKRESYSGACFCFCSYISLTLPSLFTAGYSYIPQFMQLQFFHLQLIELADYDFGDSGRLLSKFYTENFRNQLFTCTMGDEAWHYIVQERYT